MDSYVLILMEKIKIEYSFTIPNSNLNHDHYPILI
jgi:hypothetical protein